MARNVVDLNEVNRYRQWSKRNRKREDCYVCGEWREITALHHVLSFATVREFGRDAHRDLMIAAQSGVWLCPNHHALMHIDQLLLWDMIEKGRFPDGHASKLKELQEKEIELFSIMEGSKWA